MKSIAIFIFGILHRLFHYLFFYPLGKIQQTLIYQNEYVEAAQKKSTKTHNGLKIAQTFSCPLTTEPPISICCHTKAGQHVITLPDNRSLINQLNTVSEDALTSEVLADLAFLVQKDAATSALVKQAIRDSTSYGIK
ncbi:hypothetical protein P4S72_27735 [Vibrio sp. PP-XX7]